jgi:hypothetical protein
VVFWKLPGGPPALDERILIRKRLDRDLGHTGVVKTENIGGAGRDIDNSSPNIRPPVIDHENRRAVVGEVGHTDMGSKRQRTAQVM